MQYEKKNAEGRLALIDRRKERMVGLADLDLANLTILREAHLSRNKQSA
jgi:hypothetical protein